MEVPDSFPNYTGPYISNGEFQSSVAFGDKTPKDELDALSRLHDSAYAKWDDRLHRQVADDIYAKEAKKLVGKYPELAAYMVQYGNFAARSASNIATNALKFGPLGILVGGVKNMYELNQYMTKKDKTQKEIWDYYNSDPLPHLQGGHKINKEVIKFNPYLDESGWGGYTEPEAKNMSFVRSEADGEKTTKTDAYFRLPEFKNTFDSHYRVRGYNAYTGDEDTRPLYYYPNHRVKKKRLRRLKGKRVLPTI